MFSNSIRLVEIAGFQIKVDPSWLLIAALVVWSLSSGYFPQRVAGLGPVDSFFLSVAAMLALFASLIVHELAHSLVARRFGLRVGNITLFIFGGVAELDEEPATPRSEALIALAGPTASLALAGLFHLTLMLEDAAHVSPALTALTGYLSVVNLVLGLFNLLPAFPMDGGRILRAILWSNSGDLIRATRLATRIGSVFACAIILLGILSLFALMTPGGLWFVLIGVYLLVAGRTTYGQLLVRTALKGRSVRDLMTKAVVTAGPEATLAELVDGVMLPHARSFVPVVEGDHLLGYVDAGMLKSIQRENWSEAHVADIYEPMGPDNSVGLDVEAGALLERVIQSGRRKYLVAERGQLAGVISLTDLLNYIAVLSQSGFRPPADRPTVIRH